MSLIKERSEVDLIDLFLGFCAACYAFVYLFSTNIYMGPDRNLDGLFTIRDVLGYIGDGLSAPVHLLRDAPALEGTFRFFEVPPYDEPSAVSVLLGGPVMFAALLWGSYALASVIGWFRYMPMHWRQGS
jgi:hypothetical protein